MSANAATPFTRVRRLPARGVYDRATIDAVLDAAPMCHVGHIIDGRPVVIPTMHWRDGDRVYFHGSAASRMLEHGAAGGEVCLTAALFDGWVLARTGFNHSANYRSVMVFGTPHVVTEPDDKLAALAAFMERFFPGRWPALRPPTAKELKATLVLALTLDEASAKIRTGQTNDEPTDRSWPVWAGILPVHLSAGTAEAAPDSAGGGEAPRYPSLIPRESSRHGD
jgi:hypothetical protein